MRPIRLKLILIIVFLFFALAGIGGTLIWEGLVFFRPAALGRYKALRAFGHSMEPNLHNKDVVVIRILDKEKIEIKRGDIVLIEKFEHYWDKDYQYPKNLLKRIVGLPREEIIGCRGKIFVRLGKGPLSEVGGDYDTFGSTYSFRTRLRKNQYFVLGDNRSFSADSRYFGPVESYKITALKVFRISDGPLAKVIYDAMN